MSLDGKSIKEFQDIYEKETGKKLSREEAFEGANNLVNLFKVLLELDNKDRQRKLRLKDEPKGFHITSGPYNCPICYNQISDDQTWYDKWGNKCLLCQKAIDKHIIPGSLCRNKDSWYSIHELDYYFKVKGPTARKLIKQGKLKARVIPSENGGKYFELLLIKDNPGVLPKKPKSHLVKTEDGYTHVEHEKVAFPLANPET
jgi:hypothetical protein